ncbi:MAG: hypothetical protein PF569_04110 [Candidatus Woesearchaeota archaeon]|nr:hypothetical protein [Candidatus Woesearchaeota archaeon]
MNSFSGDVEVYRNDTWIMVDKNQELFLNEKIRTLDGDAKIILYGRASIDLESNTSIEIVSLIKDNLSINQLNGTTHNSFSKNNEYSIPLLQLMLWLWFMVLPLIFMLARRMRFYLLGVVRFYLKEKIMKNLS